LRGSILDCERGAKKTSAGNSSEQCRRPLTLAHEEILQSWRSITPETPEGLSDCAVICAAAMAICRGANAFKTELLLWSHLP